MDQMIPVTHVKENVPWTGTAALVKPEPWVQNALCAETDPEVFFPEQGGSAAIAKAVCKKCDVRVQCLAFAIRTNQDEGVWGGKSARQIVALRKGWSA